MGTLAVISAVTLAASAYTTYEGDVAARDAAKAQDDQIDLTAKQNVLATQQKQLANYSNMQQALQTQEAQAAGRGVSLASPSFNAIQVNTYNTGARQARNLDTEQSLDAARANAEKESVSQKLKAQTMSGLAGFAANAYSIGKDL